MRSSESADVLILGIGNVLMGDEGIGVHVVRFVQNMELPAGVICLDGGTGSFNLLDALQRAQKVVLIDATMDGAPAGSVQRLRPRFSSEYPRTLTAHDIGLKDLLDVLYMLGEPPDVTLFAISIAGLQDLGMELSPELAAVVPKVGQMVLEEVRRHRLLKLS